MRQLTHICDQIPYIYCRSTHEHCKRNADRYHWIDSCFTKIHMLSLVQYDRIVFLDADLLCCDGPSLGEHILPLHHQFSSIDRFLEVRSSTLDSNCRPIAELSDVDRRSVISTFLYWNHPDLLFLYPAPAASISCHVTRAENDRQDGVRQSSDAVSLSLCEYGARGCVYVMKPNMDHYQALMQYVMDRGGGQCSEDPLNSPDSPWKTAEYQRSHGFGHSGLFCGPDEQLITAFFASASRDLTQWTHCHRRFCINSWKLDDMKVEASNTLLTADSSNAAASDVVFLHFVTEKPWAPKADWPDFDVWNRVAMQMISEKSELSLAFDPQWMHRQLNSISRQSPPKSLSQPARQRPQNQQQQHQQQQHRSSWRNSSHRSEQEERVRPLQQHRHRERAERVEQPLSRADADMDWRRR